MVGDWSTVIPYVRPTVTRVTAPLLHSDKLSFADGRRVTAAEVNATSELLSFRKTVI